MLNYERQKNFEDIQSKNDLVWKIIKYTEKTMESPTRVEAIDSRISLAAIGTIDGDLSITIVGQDRLHHVTVKFLKTKYNTIFFKKWW